MENKMPSQTLTLLQEYYTKMSSLSSVDRTHLAIDPDSSIRETLQIVRQSGRFDLLIPPIPVIEFVREIIQKTSCNRVFIPYASGVEVEEYKKDVSVIDYASPSTYIKDLILQKTEINSISEDSIRCAEYDLIFSCLPFVPFKKDCIPQVIIDECIYRLTQEGYGIFTFANNIVYSRIARQWFSDLAMRGVFVSAIIDMPEGLYSPTTFLGSKLLVFSKKKSGKVFFAKLKEASDASVIADNYLSASSCQKAEHLGKWFEYNAFPDFTSYENDQQLQRIFSRLEMNYGGKMTPLAEICTSKLLLKPSESQFIDSENAVYIPTINMKSDVETNINEFAIKPHNYIQILVDPKKVLPEFLKFFFNTDDGILIRTMASSGTIPRLNLSSISSIEIPLPSLKMQTSILAVCTELNKIELETSRLKNRLMSKPVLYSKVAREIKDINNKGDKFEQWCESLPYPLATILKKYTTSDTYQQKQEMLLFFFEAYSIFVAAILSAIYHQPPFGNSQLKDLEISYFEKASFGSWVMMDQQIANIINSRMGCSETIPSVLNCFHTDDQSIVKRICSSKVYSILETIKDKRNTWRGHSGITSEEAYCEHVRFLEDKLQEFQKYIDDLYDRLQLIRPNDLGFHNDVFTNRVEVLTGSNPIFNRNVFDSVRPLDKEKLYIQILETKETIELPPFFVLRNSPAEVKNACYFYSRVEGSDSRYVSYHFERLHDQIEKGEAAFETIKSILERT